ncbi:MAG: fimbrial protein [Verrucomicrobiaceae bacterium]|nr:fimbrial protein [Verrucomicrobiaceae bacterium]
MKSAHGFTLVELIMTVLIIAVLSAIALPQYQEYVAKGKRSAALASLLEAAHQLERYYSANGTYLAAGGALASVYTTTVGSSSAPDYTITSSAAAQNTFTLQASRRADGTMAADRCGDIQVDQAGNQSVINIASSFADATAAAAYCLRQ